MTYNLKMIKEIRYKNFKALRDTTLQLGRFTLIVGANGTGKSTALKALEKINNLNAENFENYLSVGSKPDKEDFQVEVFWKDFSFRRTVSLDGPAMNHLFDKNHGNLGGSQGSFTNSLYVTYSHKTESESIESFKIFSFEAEDISKKVEIDSNIVLKENGQNLAGVLLNLQVSEDGIFEELNRELQNWFPEFGRIIFDFPEKGKVSFLLRTKIGNHKIKAEDLSDGTRLALAYLTLAYLPNPPKIVAFEEPEKGIHPRLLRNIQEAMYRLAYPENYGKKREPIQVIATTHSPYLLDLYKDHPEEIVISSKDENGVHFERLIDKPHYEEVLEDAPLGEVWYSGVLGGVPAQV